MKKIFNKYTQKIAKKINTEYEKEFANIDYLPFWED